MEKVILTKKQVGIIESYKKTHNLITILKRAEKGFGCKDHEEMNKLTLEEIASAWINGYEIEETAEEKILKHLKYTQALKSDFFDESYKEGARDMCYDLLNILNIKVKGINC